MGLLLVSAAFNQEISSPATATGSGQADLLEKSALTTNQAAAPNPAAPAPQPVSSAKPDLSGDLSGEALAKPEASAKPDLSSVVPTLREVGTKMEDRWLISEIIAKNGNGHPVFFGVRLANAPQVALAEIPRNIFEVGEPLPIRLWGCNDLPKKFSGRAQLALKRGDKQLESREERVSLASESAKRLATYKFDTAQLTPGKYSLETTLFDSAGEVVQKHVTDLTLQPKPEPESKAEAAAVKPAESKAGDELAAKPVRTRPGQPAEKKAAEEKEAAEKAARAAEKKAEAEAEAKLQAIDKAKQEAEQKAQAKAEKQTELDELSKNAAEKARRETELQTKQDARKKAAEEASARKAAEQKFFEEAKAQYLMQEKAAVNTKVAALSSQESEYKAKQAQADSDRQAAEKLADEKTLAAKTAQADADLKEDQAERASKAARQAVSKDEKAKLEEDAKAALDAHAKAATLAKAKSKEASEAREAAVAKVKAAAVAKVVLAKHQQRMASEKANLEEEVVKQAERKARDEVAARRLAEEKAAEDKEAAEKTKLAAEQKAKRDAEAKEKAEAEAKVRELEKAKKEAELKDQAQAKKQAELAEKANKDAELKAKADLQRKAAEEAAAQKAAEQKLFEEAKAKYLALENAAVTTKVAALTKQEAEYLTKQVQADNDRKAAEKLADEKTSDAKAAQADADLKEDQAARASKAARQAASKEEKAKLEAEAKTALDARSKAASLAKTKSKEAAEAREAAEDKAEAVTAAKAVLTKHQQRAASEKADLEAGVVKQAERKARDEVEAKRLADKKAAEAKREAELKAKAEEERKAKEAARAKALADEKVKREAELKDKEEAERKAAEEAAAQKAAEQKLFEEAKARYLTQEKAVVDTKVAVLTRQEDEYKAKQAQADSERQAAENLSAEADSAAKAVQAETGSKAMEAKRLEKVARQAVPKEEKAKLDLEAKAALEAHAKAVTQAKAKSREAAQAREAAEDKAAASAAAKAALAKHQQRMVAEKEDLEVEAVKQAESKASDDVAAYRKTQKKAAEVKRAAELKAQAELRQKEKRAGLTWKDLTKEKLNVAVGGAYRQIGAQRFRTTGSYSSGTLIKQKSTDDHWVGPAGGLSDAGNRVYDNGYVKSDAYSDLDSGTWNWGYDSGGQVKGNTLEFTGVDRVWRDYTRKVTVTDNETSDNADYNAGLMAALDWLPVHTPVAEFGLSLGLLQAQSFQLAASGLNTFEDYQRWETYEDRVLDVYDITGLGITPGSAPYHGNVNDSGPVIDTSPISRRGLGTELVEVDTYRAYNTISESLDMDLSTLSLGISLKGKYSRAYLQGSTGPTLSLLDTDATYAETLYESVNGRTAQILQYWSASSSETESLFGYYVQAAIGMWIYRGFHLGAFARYDWIESVSGDVGKTHYEVNPSGGSLGGTLGLQF